jgi:N utilization substance protein B
MNDQLPSPPSMEPPLHDNAIVTMHEAMLRKTAARCAAVQLLYGVDSDPDTTLSPRQLVKDAMDQQQERKWFFETDDPLGAQSSIVPDKQWLMKLVASTMEQKQVIDPLIAQFLVEPWTVAKLDRVARALLRVAGTELLVCPKVPLKVVINEYMVVAKAFFEVEMIDFINGILDKMGHHIRNNIDTEFSSIQEKP